MGKLTRNSIPCSCSTLFCSTETKGSQVNMENIAGHVPDHKLAVES